MSEYPDILYSVKDRIATITLNRPDRLNAYTDRLATSLKRAFADAAQDKAVRVIVITGAKDLGISEAASFIAQIAAVVKHA